MINERVSFLQNCFVNQGSVWQLLENFLLLIKKLFDFLALYEANFGGFDASIVVSPNNQTNKYTENDEVIWYQSVQSKGEKWLDWAINYQMCNCNDPVDFKDHKSHQHSTKVWPDIEVLDCQGLLEPVLVEVFGIHVELHANENQVEPDELSLTFRL